MRIQLFPNGIEVTGFGEQDKFIDLHDDQFAAAVDQCETLLGINLEELILKSITDELIQIDFARSNDYCGMCYLTRHGQGFACQAWPAFGEHSVILDRGHMNGQDEKFAAHVESLAFPIRPERFKEARAIAEARYDQQCQDERDWQRTMEKEMQGR